MVHTSTRKKFQRFLPVKELFWAEEAESLQPFTICTTDGFIVDVDGPREGTKNDAQIMKDVMQKPNGLRKLLRRGDIFILDRGFRDIVSYFEDQGFVVLMPAL